MSLDRTKADVELNGQAFRITSLTKDSAPALAPKFNTGEQGETDLQLTKAKAVKNFEGGMLQEEWNDDQMTAVSRGGYFDVLSGFLKAGVTKAEEFTIDNSNVNANSYMSDVFAVYNGELYVGAAYNSGLKPIIKKISDGTSVTLYADLASSLYPITQMFNYEDYLIILNADTGDYSWYWDGTTMLEHNAGTATIYLGRLGDNIYGINLYGNLYHIDFSTIGSPVYTFVSAVGEGDISPNCEPVEYQNRLYYAKPEGLFAFDGVAVFKALDQEFTQMVEYRGWLYLTDGKRMYRFNSVTFEMLRDFTSQGTIFGKMIATHDRLWFNVNVEFDVTEVIGGKFGGLETAGNYSLYYYDGVGFFEYENFDLTNLHVNGVVGRDYPYIVTGAEVQHTEPGIYKIDTSLEADLAETSTAFNDLFIITSIYDGGFPSVPKTLHSIKATMMIATDVDAGGDLLYRTRDVYGEWSTWTTLGTITATAPEIHLDTPQVFYALQVSYDANTNDSAIKRISFDFTLHPDRRNRWQVGLLCQGQDDYTAEEEHDGTESTVDPITLRESVYASAQSRTPVTFVEVDYTKCDGSHTDSVTTITVDSTEMFPENGTIRIGTEYISYTGKTATTFTGCTRGVWGTSNASHSDEDVVEPLYRVYLRRIVNERYILDDNTKNVDSGNTNPGLESEILVELEEV